MKNLCIRLFFLATTICFATASFAADEGFAVWAPNPLAEVREGPNHRDKNDPRCVVRIVGTRNGAFSGQIVAFGETPPGAAKIGEFKHKDGVGTIPAAAVVLRYALPTGVDGLTKIPSGHGIFDALGDRPRTEGTTHPVWITVNIPADAAPGEYETALTFAGRETPVRLTVGAWTLPTPDEYVTFVDFIQSPESVALQYKVPLWSDEHFRLLGASFDQLAKVGNKTLFLHLCCQSNLGNEQTIVRWIKEGEKSFRHDFSPVEKYLDTALKHMGRPRAVVLYKYEGFLGGAQGRSAEECQRGTRVTLLDPEKNEVSTFEGPPLNNGNPAFPDYPKDTEAFWKPVLDGLRERLNKRGIGDEAIMLGLCPDLRPGKATAQLWARIAPYAQWSSHAHGLGNSLHGAIKVGYQTTVWNARFVKTPEERNYGWRNPFVHLHNDRDIWKPSFASQLVRSRLLGELNISGKQRGFGRMSADFWPVLEGPHGKSSISARYGLSNWVQLNLRQTPYLYPGPDGAWATIRFEMLREGVQECEARIFIEKQLTNKDVREKIGEEAATKYEALLTERNAALLHSMGKKTGKEAGDGLTTSDASFAEGPWRERSARLYAAAAEIAATPIATKAATQDETNK